VVVALACLGAVMIARVAVYVVWHSDINKLTLRKLGGYAVHHFMYGFAMMLAAGYSAIVWNYKGVWVQVLFGFGVGLIIDEFFPILVVLHRYWFKKESGGETYHARQSWVVIALFITLLVILSTVTILS